MIDHLDKSHLIASRRFYLSFLLIVLIVLGLYVVFRVFVGSDLYTKEKLQAQKEAYDSFVNNYETVMRTDVYGGKTPEETLSLFIEALKTDDIELATKYFMFDTN